MRTQNVFRKNSGRRRSLNGVGVLCTGRRIDSVLFSRCTWPNCPRSAVFPRHFIIRCEFGMSTHIHARIPRRHAIPERVGRFSRVAREFIGNFPLLRTRVRPIIFSLFLGQNRVPGMGRGLWSGGRERVFTG